MRRAREDFEATPDFGAALATLDRVVAAGPLGTGSSRPKGSGVWSRIVPPDGPAPPSFVASRIPRRRLSLYLAAVCGVRITVPRLAGWTTRTETGQPGTGLRLGSPARRLPRLRPLRSELHEQGTERASSSGSIVVAHVANAELPLRAAAPQPRSVGTHSQPSRTA